MCDYLAGSTRWAGTRRKTGEVLGLILQIVRADLGVPAQRQKPPRRRKQR